MVLVNQNKKTTWPVRLVAPSAVPPRRLPLQPDVDLYTVGQSLRQTRVRNLLTTFDSARPCWMVDWYMICTHQPLV